MIISDKTVNVIQRRNFLKSLSIFMSIYPFISPDQIDMSPGISDDVVSLEIGQMKCTIFRDFMFKYLGKDFFINANGDEVNQSLKKYGATTDNIPSPFIALYIQTGDRKILIDTGGGYFENPIVFRGNSYAFKGRLQQLMLNEHIKTEEITDVIITHFHPDHIGSVYSEDDRLNFVNARFHMHQDEWNYWHSSRSDNQPGMFRIFIDKNITPLKDLNLNLIKGDFVEFLPGVTAVKADGHTPGQIAVIIHSGKEHLLYISDAFLHPLHIERLDWQTNYDQEHSKAKESRIKLLDLAYKEDMLINAFHFDFPGLGRVNKQGNNWTWGYSRKF